MQVILAIIFTIVFVLSAWRSATQKAPFEESNGWLTVGFLSGYIGSFIITNLIPPIASILPPTLSAGLLLGAFLISFLGLFITSGLLDAGKYRLAILVGLATIVASLSLGLWNKPPSVKNWFNF